MVDHQEMKDAMNRAIDFGKVKYQIVAYLDENKYKSCAGLDPNLWPNLKDKLYVLSTHDTLKWAEWSAKGYREDKLSNIDTNTVRIIEVPIED